MPHLPRAAALAALCALPLPAAAQTVLEPSDDAIIRDNLCLGDKCLDTPSFIDPFASTLLIRDSRVRIDFEDSSNDAETFPKSDWTLFTNDADSNGAEYFALQDRSANTVPLRIDSGAPTNSLFVAADGNVGLGTTIPLATLHIESGFITDIRLSRNASGGSPERSFDIRVQGAGLLFKDNVTGNFPFIIGPNAPDRAIDIETNRLVMNDGSEDYDIVMESDGNAAAFHLDAALDRIGLGTGTPEAPLHILRASTDSPGTAPAGILVEDIGTSVPRGLMTLRNTGNVFFALENTSIAAGDNTGRQWNFQNNGGEFRVTTAPGGGSDIEMRLTTAGDMIIEGNYFASSGTQLNVPDYVFDADYDLKPLSEVAAFIADNSHLPGVPSAAQINAEGLNMTDMQMRLLKKVEELTLHTIAQQQIIDTQAALNADQTARLARL